jgi:hypothetical protein
MSNENQIGPWLRYFYAVTTTSVYRATAKLGSPVRVEKIALNRGATSKAAVGTLLRGGDMLSVGKQLIAFIPEGGGILGPSVSVERDIARVNTHYWGGNTSSVVALFLEEKDALTCSESPDLVPCDPRWESQTVEVLRGIGSNHPVFSITNWPELRLLPSEKWMENKKAA